MNTARTPSAPNFARMLILATRNIRQKQAGALSALHGETPAGAGLATETDVVRFAASRSSEARPPPAPTQALQ